ncbi:type II toxin-antitoxin system VapC family toxin [Escherichia coli]|nr:type II toxin-antitoxin system VapC family toxin [Escherichia coli]
MYILDTNVISELRKARTGRIDNNVAKWALHTDAADFFISVISIMELEEGILQVERRDMRQGIMLRSWMDQHVLPAFSDKILPVDTAVALRCSRLHVPDRRSERDALIAATALVHGMTVVTRNVGDFELTGVSIINPWA